MSVLATYFMKRSLIKAIDQPDIKNCNLLTFYILKKLPLILFFLMLALTSFCQRIQVKVVFDSENKAPVEVASLKLFEIISGRDSLIQHFTGPLRSGQLLLTFVKNTHYRLKAYTTNLGTAEKIILSDSLKEDIPVRLFFSKVPFELKEVIVKAQRDRFVQSGDSVLIQIKAGDARPHASSATLFDRIPGLGNDLGRISVLGKSVQEVTVNGQRVFGGDPALSLEAIKADMVDQIEFTEKNPTGGQTQNTLNLKLKSDKQKGVYGLLGAGLGLNGNYLLNGTFNKLTKNGFLNVFSTGNDINQRGMDVKKVYRSGYTIMKSMMNKSGSVVGLYDNAIIEEEDILATLAREPEGMNRYGDSGVNYTFSGDKLEIEAFAFANLSRGNLNRRTDSRLFLGQIGQTSVKDQIQHRFERGVNANVTLAWKPDSRTSLRFTSSITTGFSDKKLNDTIRNSFDGIIPGNEVFSFSEIKSENLEYRNQLSLVRTGKRRGEVASMLLQSGQQRSGSSVNFANEIRNIFSDNLYEKMLYADPKASYVSFQTNYARPVSKRVLLESKLKWTYDSRLNLQQYDISPYHVDNDLIGAKVVVKNDLLEAGLYAVYPRPRFKLITGLTYLNWKMQRENQVTKFYHRKTYLLNPFTKLEFTLNRKVFWVRYATEPVLPTWQQTGSLPDSSNVNAMNMGNIMLTNSLQRILELNSSFSYRNGLHIVVNMGYKRFINPVISANLFNPELNLFSTTYINSHLPGSGFNINLTAFRIKLNSRFSAFYMGGLVHLSSFQMTEAQSSPLKDHNCFSKPQRQFEAGSRRESQRKLALSDKYIGREDGVKPRA